MAPRLELQALLIQLLGSANVYFQQPPSNQMKYPCIVYSRDDAKAEFAENKPYKHMWRYQVTVIDPDPDSPIPALIAELPMCAFNRHFTADKLNHDVFNLFF